MKRFSLWLCVSLFLAPIAALWAFYQEKRITKFGNPLDERTQEWAGATGIFHAEDIRFIRESALHFPSPQWLKQPLEKRGLCLSQAAGMCLRYGIFIHEEADLTDRLIRHELAHTLQYQRHGSIYRFMQQYLFECLFFGYHHAPMELEAEEIAHCKPRPA